MCKSQGISRFVCSITPQSFCIVAVPLLNHANIFFVSQSFKVSLHFFHLIIEVSHQKIDIQHQAKRLSKFQIRETQRNTSTYFEKFKYRWPHSLPAEASFPPASFLWYSAGRLEKKNGWVANYEVACFFCMSFADLWLLYGFHWKRFVLSRFCLNPFTFVVFRNS